VTLTTISVAMLKKLLAKSGAILFCTISLFMFIGCVTSKDVPSGQISKTPNWKNLYYFHSGDSTWIVRPVTEAGNKFTGLIYSPEVIKRNRQVHIYAEPLSSVKIRNGKLTVPMENIVKVENHKINAGMIIASVGILGLLFLLPVIF
jgi:hypothetical protein